MDLVGYSDSEGSDVDVESTVTKPTQPAGAPAQKPVFQKVVDRSNPRKIIVNLPSSGSADKEAAAREADDNGPVTKRARLAGDGGGGLFSGINSFLPAPKRMGQTAGMGDVGGNNSSKRSIAQGLGSGFSLKTGASPAFSRDPPTLEKSGATEESSFVRQSGPMPVAGMKEESEIQLVGKTTMFRPLSVANKANAKKKPKRSAISSQAQNTNAMIPSSKSDTPAAANTPSKPKISLFSMADPATESPEAASSTEYKPMMLEATDDRIDPKEDVDQVSPHSTLFDYGRQNPVAQVEPQIKSSNLQDLAKDLNLSSAARRQLFGRTGRDIANAGSVNIVNFNTDAEYAANEELRAKGEVVTHQPVRSIAPGKHSLRQLVNTAVTQKDALEESFSQGQKNRKEAGSRYGW